MDGIETSQPEAQAVNTEATNATEQNPIVATEGEGKEQGDSKPTDFHTPKAIEKMEKRIGKVTGELKTTKEQLEQAMALVAQLRGFVPQDQLAKADEDLNKQFAEHNAKKQEQAKAEHYNSLKSDFSTKLQEAAKSIPDVVNVVASCSVPLSDGLESAILESNIGPQLAYYLAKNPKEIEYINSLTDRAQDRYIARLETRLETEAIKPKAQAPVPTAGAAPRTSSAAQVTISNSSPEQILEYQRKHGKLPPFK